MRTDYHMHPMITQKPERFDEFAKKALAIGIEEVCITDHMPLSISNAADRIPAGKVGEYCRNVREAAERYEGKLSVKLGIEVDYHPAFVREIEDVLAQGDFDFVLGSTHMHLFLADQLDGRLSREEFARRALENTLAAVKSGYFQIIPHFDMFRWAFSKTDRYFFSGGEYRMEAYLDLITEILDEIAARGIRLEINPHFAETQKRIENTYPEAPIVEMALARNIQFQYGSDAHAPNSVGALLDTLLSHPVYGKALARK